MMVEDKSGILTAVIGLGVVLGVGAYLAGLYAIAFLGSFLATWGILMLVAAQEDTFLHKAVEDFINEWIREKSGFSFYGLMALSYFLKWETALLVREVIEFEFDADNVIRVFISRVIGISIQTLRNSLESLIWPWHMIREYEILTAVLLVALCWVIVWTGSRSFTRQKWGF